MKEKLTTSIQKTIKINTLAAKNRIDESNRNMLLPQDAAKKTDSAVEQSAILTDSMQTAMGKHHYLIDLFQEMMRNELEKSSATLLELDAQSNTIKDTQKEYNTYGEKLVNSRSITRSISRQQVLDAYLLYFGLFIFTGTIFYIVQKRLWIPSFLNPLNWIYKFLNYILE